MTYNNFDGARLPKASSNENLETISSNLLRMLFPVEKFEIRSETCRDKGIDFHVELKKTLSSGGWGYTNYRFAIQLKATNTIKSTADGKYGMQISSSNITYLLNSGMPAYYIFYHHPTHCFYYESAKNLVVQLQEKNQKWQQKIKHKVYFSKKLDRHAVQGIYEETYASGDILKNINRYLTFPYDKESSQGVIIDADNLVHSVQENIQYIDQFGADLVNRNHFSTIIEIEKRSWPRNSATPRFYLFCGIAYFQRGNLFRALELLNEAKKHSKDFDRQGNAIIDHTILSARYLLDMISREEYDSEMKKIMSLEDAGAFFRIERAFEELSTDTANPAFSIIKFYDSMKKIIENEKSPIIRTVAYNKIIDAESAILYRDLAMNFTYFIGRVIAPLQSRAYLEWLEIEKKFLERLDAIANYADRCGHHIGIGNLTLASIKWNYEKAIHTHYLTCWTGRNFDLGQPINDKIEQMLKKQCDSLDKLAQLYEATEYRENMISCMVLKFEILHFSRQYDEAQKMKEKTLDAINSNGFEGLKKKYRHIFRDGTAHERFIEKYTLHMNRIQDLAIRNGIDCYKPLNEEQMNSKTAWSIKDFVQLDLTICQ